MEHLAVYIYVPRRVVKFIDSIVVGLKIFKILIKSIVNGWRFWNFIQNISLLENLHIIDLSTLLKSIVIGM